MAERRLEPGGQWRRGRLRPEVRRGPGQSAATTRPWRFYFPGLLIALVVLSVNLVGDGLRDALDPRSGFRRPQ